MNHPLLQKASIVLTPTAYGTGILNSIKPVYSLGTELVTNGDFSNGSNDWNVQTGWTIANGIATVNHNATTAITQSLSGVRANFLYEIKLTISNYTQGLIQPQFSGQVITQFTGNGEHTFEVVSTSSTPTLYLYAISNPQFSIDNVSIKEVTDADFDFTRSTTATRVNERSLIETVAANIPRIDFTGGTGSILLEPQRTNQTTNSDNIHLLPNGTGGDGAVTSTANYAISPEGTQSATRIVASATGSGYAVKSSTAVTSTSGSYSGSVWLKSNTSQNQTIAFYGRNSSINSVEITTNWQRYEFTGSGSTNFCNVGVYPVINSITSVDFLAWGMQIEHGSYATSLIHTSGSAVTRSADAANNAGNSDLINSTEGVLYAEIAALADDLTFRTISVSDGTTSNRIVLRYGGTSNFINVLASSGGSNVFDNNFTLSEITDFNKIAIKYKVNDYALWVNGNKVKTDTSGAAPVGLSQVQFANAVGNSNIFYGKVKCIAVFKEALSDTELVTLTS